MTRPRPILTIDAETDPFAHGRTPKAFVWGLYDGVEFRHYWEDTPAFVADLFPRRAYAYAHYGGNFDFHLLAPHFRWGTRIRPTRYGLTQIWPADGQVELRDSWPILRRSLGAYRKDTIDYLLFEKERREDHRREIVNYLRTDCIALHELVSAFSSAYGHRHVTIGQAALAELRRIQGLETTRAGETWDRRFRPYHYGGRCQVFRGGCYAKRFGAWDLNSAYGHAMTQAHPWGHRSRRLATLPSDPDRLGRCFAFLVARSTGCLPYREGRLVSYPDDGKLREYHATGHEILAGLELGQLQIERVLDVLELEDQVTFEPYVSHFWGMKQRARIAGDKAQELIAKAFLTSLYGKLAQDARRNRQLQVMDPGTAWRDHRDGWRQVGHLGGKPIMARDTEPPYLAYLNVATAASITGMVRARLLRSIARSEDVLYVDTDSIVCGALDPSQAVGDSLGDWKPEGTFDHAAIAGKKLYAFRYLEPQNGHTHKTASKGAQLSASQIERVARGHRVRYDAKAPTFRVGGPPMFQRRVIRRTIGRYD